MKLQILKNSKVGDIKKQFMLQYPFLKLEILRNKPSEREMHHQIMADDKESLSAIQPKLKEGAIKIEDKMMVSDLESIFQKNHLLNVQVFRKSGNLWLETTMTDSWTLERQNSHGREISETIDSPTNKYIR